MQRYLDKWLKKTSCLSKLDINSIPIEETVVFYDDGEHLFTVRREKSANIFCIKTITGETVMECMEYLANGKIETIKYDKDLVHSSLFIFFTERIRKKGENKHLNKHDPFFEVNKLLYHLREYPEFLTDEEYYRLKETFPNDLNEMKRVYGTFLSDEKKEAKKYLEDASNGLLIRLKELKEKVYQRKTTKLEVKNEVIKKRL